MNYVIKWTFLTVLCCILGLIFELLRVYVFNFASHFSIFEALRWGVALTVCVALLTLVEKVTGGRKEK